MITNSPTSALMKIADILIKAEGVFGKIKFSISRARSAA